jgi:WXXGXW repeat (2 copies)
MLTRSLIIVLAAAAISTPAVVAPAIFTPAAAQADLNIGLTVGVPPPPPMYEPIPAPRVGYVWAPSFWRWEGGRHVWAPGRWMAERRGYHWVPDRWAEVHGGWHHDEGHWDHDVERHGFDHWH